MDSALLLLCCLVGFYGVAAENYTSNPVVQRFREYVQINTTTGNNLTAAVEFWTDLANSEGLPISVYEFTEGYPVIVITWAGTNSSLSGIMLNSHMDVVPASFDDGWTYEPFEAYMDENGDIYGRGTQDMKSVSIQYFEALRRLKADNVTLLRNVYMTLMPDEEVGADSGMKPFLESDEFAALNVGFEMDEGSSYPLPIIPIFYQDKAKWQIQIDCYGVASHGSSFPATNSTATGKCRNVIDTIFKFRDDQYQVASKAAVNNAGTYTSINLNILSGGTADNVVPSQVTLSFDVRLATTLNEDEFNATVQKWVDAAGENITITYTEKNAQSPATIANSSNPYWTAISNAASAENFTILAAVPPGSTDARHVRRAGVPAFGFSPMPNTPLLLHSVNERINVETLLNGINYYEAIIKNLANIPAEDTSTDPSVYLTTTAV